VTYVPGLVCYLSTRFLPILDGCGRRMPMTEGPMRTTDGECRWPMPKTDTDDGWRMSDGKAHGDHGHARPSILAVLTVPDQDHYVWLARPRKRDRAREVKPRPLGVALQIDVDRSGRASIGGRFRSCVVEGRRVVLGHFQRQRDAWGERRGASYLKDVAAPV